MYDYMYENTKRQRLWVDKHKAVQLPSRLSLPWTLPYSAFTFFVNACWLHLKNLWVIGHHFNPVHDWFLDCWKLYPVVNINYLSWSITYAEFYYWIRYLEYIFLRFMFNFFFICLLIFSTPKSGSIFTFSYFEF